MTRQAKTPRQRAEEALALAERAYTRLTDKARGLRDDLTAVEKEQRAALARLEHLKQHPDLQQPRTTSTGDNA